MDNDFAMGYALGSDSNDGKNVCVVPANNGGWGGNGSWGEMIFAIIILAMFAGGDGFGNGGLFGGGRGGASGEIQRGFDTSAIVNKLDGINSGLCDGFYAMNTGMLNGFNSVNQGLCNIGYQTQQGFNATQVAMMQGNNALSTQLAQCCCDNRVGQMNITNAMVATVLTATITLSRISSATVVAGSTTTMGVMPLCPEWTITRAIRTQNRMVTMKIPI